MFYFFGWSFGSVSSARVFFNITFKNWDVYGCIDSVVLCAILNVFGLHQILNHRDKISKRPSDSNPNENFKKPKANKPLGKAPKSTFLWANKFSDKIVKKPRLFGKLNLLSSHIKTPKNNRQQPSSKNIFFLIFLFGLFVVW